MKMISTMSNYNLWANKKVALWCGTIDDDQWTQKLISSYLTIKDTVLHLCGAERIWNDRLIGVQKMVWLPDSFEGDRKSAIQLLLSGSKALVKTAEQQASQDWQNPIAFNNLDGSSNQMIACNIFMHVLNHSTYHRGQIVTMLRQVGFTDVSSTDINYYLQIKNTEQNDQQP